ncbi:putative ribonuclease ZC3H12D [Rhynchophorus ferrugineus]|uniref:putative ribonuclease ZC3H12D n=1 Tax=Rhynchophorus ferrugineus TaxID=354439 RepID=UPI003FCDFA5D
MVKQSHLKREKEKLRKFIKKRLREKCQVLYNTSQRKPINRKEDNVELIEPHKTDKKTRRNLSIISLRHLGKNIYCPSIKSTRKKRRGLRPIYIDGSNIAFSHGQNERFSVRGIQICIDYFRRRGHEVKAFVPHFRLRKGETTDAALLQSLVDKKLVITTPTLYIENQRRNPYDDWYIVQSAAATGGIIVSRDNFRDIVRWNPNLRPVIENRRLVPTFVGDILIFPVDPHGNRKNDLETFLRYN